MFESETNFSEGQNLSIVQLISNNKGKNITKQIRQAIQQGKDINQSENEMTPLHLSIKLEDFKLTQFLIKNGADKYDQSNLNQTIIECVMLGRNSKIIDLIFSNKSKTIQNSLYQNLLFEKAKKCQKNSHLACIEKRSID